MQSSFEKVRQNSLYQNIVYFMCLTSDFMIVCNVAITWSATVVNRKSFELVSYVVRILMKHETNSFDGSISLYF